MKTSIRNPNWLYGRPNWHNYLTIVLVFTTTTVIGLPSGLNFVPPPNQITEVKANTSLYHALPQQIVSEKETKNKEPKNDNKMEYILNDICLTAECVHTASAILRKMKEEIEPCDDFHQFACGNYLRKTQTPEVAEAVNTFPTISDKWLVQLRDILTVEQPQTEPRHRRLANIFYKACMDTTSIERLGTQYIHQVSHILGGWPVLYGNCWDSANSWTWPDVVKKFRRIGYSSNSVVYLSIGVDSRNSSRRIINLDQSLFGLKREYLIKGFNDTYVSAYYDHMVDLAVLFGAEKEKALEELRESLQFEIALARISWPDDSTVQFNTIYNLRSIKQLQESYPYVQWLDYINAYLPEGLEVDEYEEVNLAVPKYFDDLGKLLKRTTKRVIANYMMWHFHEVSVSFLPEEFRKRRFQYNTILSGKQVQRPRWKECVDVTLDSLPIAVGSLYMRRYFNEDAKVSILEMINNTRSAFSQILENVKWMDDKTKQEAKKKLESMKVRLGYPEEMLADDKLEEFYRKLEIVPNNYFESYLKLNVFTKDYLFGTLKMPMNKTDWIGFENLVTSTSFYSPPENSLNFPAGVFQAPLFDFQRAMYINYGIMGSIIGHEIARGFDSIGHQFDGDGNLMDWGQPETEKVYSEKAECIIEQFGNYADNQTGLRLDVVNTQSRNIADITGTKASYLAYKLWVGSNGKELLLPGLNYTPQQMFWISAAQSWCAKYDSESQLIIDDHLPAKFRVLSAFSNIKSFSCDFQCRQNTTMNPAQRCEFW